MKAIINNHLYDTETASLLATYDTKLPLINGGTLIEHLYQKSNGEFFLYGKEGRYETNYYSQLFGEYMYSDILPLDEYDAQEWVATYLDANTYIEIFGKPEE